MAEYDDQGNAIMGVYIASVFDIHINSCNLLGQGIGGIWPKEAEFFPFRAKELGHVEWLAELRRFDRKCVSTILAKIQAGDKSNNQKKTGKD